MFVVKKVNNWTLEDIWSCSPTVPDLHIISPTHVLYLPKNSKTITSSFCYLLSSKWSFVYNEILKSFA